jgi:hypothetical protein
MNLPPTLRPAPLAGPDLDDSLAAVELRLAALSEALRVRDVAAIDCHSAELHRALAQAVSRFSAAAARGPVAPALRHRLANAGGVVAAQRESLARATAALDRAMDVLMPRQAAPLYGAGGAAARNHVGSGVQA